MDRRLISVLFLFVWTSAALAQFGSSSTTSQAGVRLRSHSITELIAEQKVLLSDYCRLDFEGARLVPNGWDRLKPFTSLHANPEFTRITIVTRFNVESPERPSEELTVAYQTVGFYQGGEGYTADASGDQVTFRVQEHNGDLLVTEIRPVAPHVSPRAASAWINQRLADPNTSDAERALLKDALRQIDKLLPQPHSETNSQGR
jgi:hypothetical protein